jgi:hypothetical protein
MNEGDRDRLHELLADRAVQGLSPEDREELNELMKEHPEWFEEDDVRLDVAAAAVDLANADVDEPLPEALRERIVADAYHYFDTAYPQASRPEAADATPGSKPGDLRQFQPSSKSGSARRWQQAGWYVAAACLILAVLGWYPRLTRPKTPPPPTLAELRSRLMAEAPDLIRTSWAPATYEPGQGVGGDVVWSNAEQKGYMRFQGLPAVDPSVSEYQLWIFDADQDERYPIDGGVFDVNEATGEVIVRIDAKIKVAEPKLFAVTVEKPGGVVVSKRDKLMLIAKVE